MQLLKNELKMARDILDKISVKFDRGAMFFDIDVSEDVENSDSLIILTEAASKKPYGYSGLTKLGLIKFPNHYDEDLSAYVPTKSQFGYINLDYCPRINLKDLHEIGLFGKTLDKEELEFLFNKDCYLIQTNSIVTLFE